MRTYRHWTPRYLFNRLLEKIYRWRHPNAPWLTPKANRRLAQWIKPHHTGVEFGSGRSTIWFARRVASLTSVEHDASWYARVSEQLKHLGLEYVRYLLLPRQDDLPQGAVPDYVAILDTIRPATLDFVLVDGIYRDACAVAVIDKLKPGGVLILDNANLYLPSKSHSPNSIKFGQSTATPMWEQFQDCVHTWETIWTSNGASDTAFFYKPQS